MVTKILLTIMLVLYIALLIMRYKKKGNPKIEGGVQVVQGVLWSFIAVGQLGGTFHWNENCLHRHHSYVVYSRNQGLYRCRQ